MMRIWLPVLILLSVNRGPSGFVIAQTAPQDSIASVVRMLDTPADFEGRVGWTLDPDRISEVRIGWFAPDDPTHPVAGPAYRAAQLAVEEANEEGGYQGLPFRVVNRWDDDPWAGGSREVTRLIFRDSVLAVIGSIDGDATHLAEQITSKTWVPLVSPISADPTLTYINIPWIFRLPPDEETQAKFIVTEGLVEGRYSRVGLITSIDHDGRVFAESVEAALEAVQKSPLFHFQVEAEALDAGALLSRASGFSPDALIVRLPSKAARLFVDAIQERRPALPVFLPWIPGLGCSEDRTACGRRHVSILPFAPRATDAYGRFREAYVKRYDVMPAPAAALTYDAVRLVVAAIRKAGLNRAAIRKAIAESSGFDGVTGTVFWDNGGGNVAAPVLVRGR